MSAFVRFSEVGRTAVLALNRPEARNALSIDLLRDLHTAVDSLATRTDISVLTLTGEGKSFCAGMDLKAVLGGHDLAKNLLRSLAELTIKLRAVPMVTLAKINGAAIGGGCGLACVCDIAITHADAKLGYPEVDLGVCPAVVAPWLVKKVGPGKARRILLQGGLMTGQQAHEIGMVDHLVSEFGELEDAARGIAERLATGGPHALRATKALLNRIDGSVDDAIVLEGAALSARVLATPETQEMLSRRQR